MIKSSSSLLPRLFVFLFALLFGIGVGFFSNSIYEKKEKRLLEANRMTQVEYMISAKLHIQLILTAYSLEKFGISVEHCEPDSPMVISAEQNNNLRINQVWSFKLGNMNVADVRAEQRSQVEAEFRQIEEKFGAFVQLKIKKFSWVEPNTVQIHFVWFLNDERFGWNYK